jgi:hypothetical protein
MRTLPASVAFLLALTACTTAPTPSEGSGSPFTSGSIAASVEGSDDLTVSQTIRDPDTGIIHTIFTYTGSCDHVNAQITFSYTTNGQTVPGQQVGHNDVGFTTGRLAPNQPYNKSYAGEVKFTPDSIVFVISNERCV